MGKTGLATQVGVPELVEVRKHSVSVKLVCVEGISLSHTIHPCFYNKHHPAYSLVSGASPRIWPCVTRAFSLCERVGFEHKTNKCMDASRKSCSYLSSIGIPVCRLY